MMAVFHVLYLLAVQLYIMYIFVTCKYFMFTYSIKYAHFGAASVYKVLLKKISFV